MYCDSFNAKEPVACNGKMDKVQRKCFTFQ